MSKMRPEVVDSLTEKTSTEVFVEAHTLIKGAVDLYNTRRNAETFKILQKAMESAEGNLKKAKEEKKWAAEILAVLEQLSNQLTNLLTGMLMSNEFTPRLEESYNELEKKLLAAVVEARGIAAEAEAAASAAEAEAEAAEAAAAAEAEAASASASASASAAAAEAAAAEAAASSSAVAAVAAAPVTIEDPISVAIKEAMDKAIKAAKGSWGYSYSGSPKVEALTKFKENYVSPAASPEQKKNALKDFIFCAIEARKTPFFFGKAKDGYTASAKAFYQSLYAVEKKRNVRYDCMKEVAEALNVAQNLLSMSIVELIKPDGNCQSTFANIAVNAKAADETNRMP